MSAAADPSFEPDSEGLAAALALFIDGLGAPARAPLDLPNALPEGGAGERGALERLGPSVVGGARRLTDPGYLAHMDPPSPWVAWAGAQWAAALNQNLLHSDTAPVARDLERVVVGWLAPFFGMNGGHLVPGSSVANLTALWAARELRGVEEVVASEAAHLSAEKAARLLGLEFRTVPVDERRRLRADALGDLSRAALLLTAGTTATGAVDPLDAGAEAAWRHVDAAWAGSLRLTDRHPAMLDGIESADSVAVSAHKWLFQPKECALALFRDTAEAHGSISFGGGGYLAEPNVGVLGSHGAAALPLAATLLAWGRAGLAARIERCMEIAARLVELVDAEPALERFSGPETGVVVWRPRAAGDLDELRARMDRAFVSATTIDGERWLRSVSANPMADPELVVAEVLRARGS